MNRCAGENRQEVERRVLLGLACEWKEAVAYLPDGLRERMRPPLFALKEFTGPWGKWETANREIAVSRRLVWDYPWVSVRDVLLHEMAHQMAAEVFGGDPTPHGERFREACRHLRADPAATAEYVPLAERPPRDGLDEGDRILVRVKKLLALAQSANPHEAESAMAKAHALIANHNVDMLARLRDPAYCSVCVGEPLVRRRAPDLVLACLLSDFYFVEGIWVSAYVLEKDCMGSVLEISGRPENVKMAGYVHEFLRRVIDRQWAGFSRGKALSRRQETDFAVGVLQGFRRRLEKQEERWRAGEGKALALVKKADPRLRSYFRERYPHIRRSSGRGRRVDMDVQRAGEKIGLSTVLARPLEAGRTNRRLLLQ